MEKLNKDFLTFIELLESEGVEYLVVGGYAVALHGFPRYTGDIDFFIAINRDNAQRCSGFSTGSASATSAWNWMIF